MNLALISNVVRDLKFQGAELGDIVAKIVLETFDDVLVWVVCWEL